MVKDDSHNELFDYTRNLLEQQNRREDQFCSLRTYDAVADIQKKYLEQSSFLQLTSVFDAAKKLHDQFRPSGFTSEIQRMQDQFRSSSIAAEIQKIQSLSSGFTSEIQRMQDQFRSSSIAAEIQKIQSLSSGFTSEIQRMQDQFRSSGIAAAIQKIQNNSVSSVITRLNEMAENLRNVDYVVNPNGTITGQNNIFNQSAVQTIIESYLETAQEADNVGIEIKFNNILNDILKHHPVISKIIITILLPLFIGIFIAIYFSPPIKNDYALLAKQLKKEVRQIEIGSEFYNSFRFVSAQSLTVRSKNSTKSKCIGILYFGNLVRIIQKKKNWTLVEYRDNEGNIIIQGWVFTRYIKRLD